MNLREAIDLINYMFFQTNENLKKLGKNSDHVGVSFLENQKKRSNMPL